MIKKKKALINTLFDEKNMGNRLQNYALQQVLINYGLDVTTIDNRCVTFLNIKWNIGMYVKGVLGCVRITKYESEFKRYNSTKKLKKACRKFNEEKIGNIIKTSNKGAFKRDWSEYDVAFVGSDQVWHKWGSDKLELPFYYLEFLPKNKRVAYAASFGFENFPTVDIKQHKEGIKGMNFISCREKRGCELVSSVDGKGVKRVLDPTLLLDVAEWRKLENQIFRLR